MKAVREVFVSYREPCHASSIQLHSLTALQITALDKLLLLHREHEKTIRDLKLKKASKDFNDYLDLVVITLEQLSLHTKRIYVRRDSLPTRILPGDRYPEDGDCPRQSYKPW